MKNITLSFRDLARAGHVTRWHSVRVGRPQTLAEHHYLVSMFTNKLAKDILPDITDTDRLQMVEYAMWHDLPEIICGDLPSPLKRRIEQLCPDNNPVEVIEEQVAPWLIALKQRIQVKPEQAIIVKLADIIDAILFIEQEGIGDHAKTVAKYLRQQFEEKVQLAKKDIPNRSWEKAEALLDDLLGGGEQNKILFEQVDC